MKTNKGLVCAFLLDGKGGATPMEWDEIKSWTPEQGCLWVHLDYTSKHSQQWLRKESGIDPSIVSALCALESRPRAIQEPNGLALFLRGVNLNPGSDPEDMVSVRIWTDQYRIISTRKRLVLSTQDIKKKLEENRGPKNQSDFLATLITLLVNRMSDVINRLDEAVDELEESILTAETHELRPLIADIRRQTISLRRYLAPQRDALTRLLIEKTPWINKNDLVHIRESSDRIMRYIEDLDSARDRAAVTQEELSSKLSDQLNQRMYILAVVAVIFLPLTFITGLLGINVGGIPGTGQPYAFTLITISLFVTGTLIAVFFKLKKWF